MDMVDLAELQCIICYDTFENPVTLYCGHSFCKSCILSCLAKNTKCPSCKVELFQSHNLMVDQSLQNLIKRIHSDPVNITDSENPEISSGIIKKLIDKLKSEFPDPQLFNQVISGVHKKTVQSSKKIFKIEDCWSISVKNRKVAPNLFLKCDSVSEKLKLICFRIPQTGFVPIKFVAESNYSLFVEFQYSDALFQKLIVQGKFVGILSLQILEASEGQLFQFKKINYFNASGVNLEVKCLGTVKMEHVFIYNFALNFSFLAKLEPKPNKVKVYWTNCNFEKQVVSEMNNECFEGLQKIEAIVVYFLNKLQKKNSNYYDVIVSDYGLAVVDKKLSISFADQTERFLNVVLNIVDLESVQRIEALQTVNLKKKIEQLLNFLEKTRPSSDPLFVLVHSEEARLQRQFQNSALILVLLVLLSFFMMIYTPAETIF